MLLQCDYHWNIKSTLELEYHLIFPRFPGDGAPAEQGQAAGGICAMNQMCHGMYFIYTNMYMYIYIYMYTHVYIYRKHVYSITI